MNWRIAAFLAMLAGVVVGPQLPREVIIVVPPVLIAGFVIGYLSAVRDVIAAARPDS
ncbi:MAG TPA: hypothetical protein VE777_02125 [Gaiellales bacterium]|nr:hypothetical protein [Gaiellales bacterium]